MDFVHLLPDAVANQIAAGEVIQRPASCLKELVENSLDAGADEIQILVRDAGRTLIQVTDNGKGMSPNDARLSFSRHATSKIQSAADLFDLHTMGFRGEALPSICAVAQVEMLTRPADSELGTRICIDGSELLTDEPCATGKGTTIRVKNLFFNVPARRRFLKTNQTELRNIVQEFQRIVLVNPRCRFVLVSDDEVLADYAAGTLKQRIEQVFGRSKSTFTSSLVELHTDTDIVSIRGYIGKPESAGKTAQQFFFVNNRFMRHPYFHKAVQTAYQGLLPADQQAAYFIYFDVSPDAIDVNIHPTKTEIKFADEQTIFQLLLACLREALGKFSVAPSIDFSSPLTELDTISIAQSGKPLSTYAASAVPSASTPLQTSYDPFRRQMASAAGWQQLYNAPTEQEIEQEDSNPFAATGEVQEQGQLDLDIPISHPQQLHGRWLMLPTDGGMLLVDQHRAHSLLRYDELRRQLSQHAAVMQQLLFPETITLSADDVVLLRAMRDDLLDIGFDLEQISADTFAINAIPAVLGSEAPQPALQDVLTTVREARAATRDAWQEPLLRSLAESSALPYGRSLSEEEMHDLLKRLFAMSSHRYTPDGRAVMAIVGWEELARYFK